MNTSLFILLVAFVATTTIPISTALAQQFAHPANPNDWGKVVSDRAQDGNFGAHSSNPIPDPPNTPPNEIDREVPRDGVGNVQLNDQEIPKHPAFHADALCKTFGPRAPGCDAIDASDDPVRDPLAPQGSNLPTLQQMQGQ